MGVQARVCKQENVGIGVRALAYKQGWEGMSVQARVCKHE